MKVKFRVRISGYFKGKDSVSGFRVRFHGDTQEDFYSRLMVSIQGQHSGSRLMVRIKRQDSGSGISVRI